MILVDTSIWVDHFRRGHSRLQFLLEEGMVLVHSFVIGELACGSFKNRDEILHLLNELPCLQTVDHSEVMHLMETKHLFESGIGWIDAHLLASALLSGCFLWTADRRLEAVAAKLALTPEFDSQT
jgi:predicted nucleic acid-binding protein